MRHRNGNIGARKGLAWGIGLAALLAGCANNPLQGEWIQAYPGAQRPVEEIATLVRGNGSPIGFPDTVDGVNYHSFVHGMPSAIEVLPGGHAIVVRCIWGTRTANPSMRGYVQAGHYYALSCHNTVDNRAAADLLDLGPIPPTWLRARPDASGVTVN